MSRLGALFATGEPPQQHQRFTSQLQKSLNVFWCSFPSQVYSSKKFPEVRLETSRALYYSHQLTAKSRSAYRKNTCNGGSHGYGISCTLFTHSAGVNRPRIFALYTHERTFME